MTSTIRLQPCRSTQAKTFVAKWTRTISSSSVRLPLVHPGEWNDDDYDVLANGTVVGRILKSAAAPVGMPLALDAGLRPPRRSHAHLRL
jgi:hypothetical protein